MKEQNCMRILNEDELHLYGIKVSDGERKYKNKDARNDDILQWTHEEFSEEEIKEILKTIQM